LRAGFFQFDCRYGQPEANRERVKNALKGQEFDLLVLPELFTTGYFFPGPKVAREFSEKIPEGPTTEFLIRLARKHQAYIIAGIAEIGPCSAYNSAVVIGPGGFIGHHRKIHLTGLEAKIFDRGDRISIFDLNGVMIGLAICYDLWFPELTRKFQKNRVQLICHPANFGGTMSLDIARARAIENVAGVITANRIGVENSPEGEERFRGESRIIDCQGEILAGAGSNEALIIEEFNLPVADNPLQLGADLQEEISLYSSGRIKLQTYQEKGI